MAAWQIDGGGRIFHEGVFVARIERASDLDGRYTRAFRVNRVQVESDFPFTDPAFETAIVGTSAEVTLTSDQWHHINKAAV